MIIGNKIREARKAANNGKGMTQKELGALCGIDEANIRKYESGRQKPKIETLQKIGDALGVSWTYFTDMFEETESLDSAKKEHDKLLEEQRWVEITEKIIQSIYGHKKTVSIKFPNTDTTILHIDVYGDDEDSQFYLGDNLSTISHALCALFYNLVEDLGEPAKEAIEDMQDSLLTPHNLKVLTQKANDFTPHKDEPGQE